MDHIREIGGAHEAVINIENLATSFGKKMKNQPKKLKPNAGGSKCSIFRIPQNLEEINPQAYHPHIVSIGPYHHGKQDLSMMEEHKGRLLMALLDRSQQRDEPLLRDYLKAMAELEHDARACYSEEITTIDSEQFVTMLLLDGCFLVELFRLFDEDVEDPIFSIPWLLFDLARDLLRLENQLPLFVLQRLFELSNDHNVEPQSSFPLLAIKFFRWAVISRPDEAIEWATQKERSHLLDLFRATFISPELEEREKKREKECEEERKKLEERGEYKPCTLLHCVTKLVRAGIKFRPMNEAKTFLDIKFERGVLMIPHLKVDDSTSSFLQNCIAFEQSHQHSDFYFTSFATFMDFLIHTEKDVSLLVDAKVINNRIGKDDELANFFNKLGKAMVLDLRKCYLGKEFEEVNGYYGNRCNAGDQIRENVISIEDLATSIEGKVNQPKHLKSTAGDSECSIFRIPRNLEAINQQAYHPHIISIGPYHHKNPKLNPKLSMEEHKRRFLNVFLARSNENKGPRLPDYLKAMAELEDRARACYSEEITKMNSEQFLSMLLLDGCFLVELFRLFEEDQEDPIFGNPWMILFVARDLLKLENQLPLFAVQRLFELSNYPKVMPKSSFPLLAIKFFSWALIPRPEEAIRWSTRQERKHLLDLFRATFISPGLKVRAKKCKPIRLPPCATKLFRAGIKFRPMKKANTFFTFLDTKFQRRVLMIPHLVIDDFTSSFLQNCIAFEQSHMACGNYFTSFAFFMDCLINTGEDVSLLGNAKVIQNNFGTDDELADFFNTLGRVVVLGEEIFDLAKELEEVNRYYYNDKNVEWTEFKSTHMSAPWFYVSAMAASILLILTVIQTIYTIYPYYHPNN